MYITLRATVKDSGGAWSQFGVCVCACVSSIESAMHIIMTEEGLGKISWMTQAKAVDPLQLDFAEQGFVVRT